MNEQTPYEPLPSPTARIDFFQTRCDVPDMTRTYADAAERGLLGHFPNFELVSQNVLSALACCSCTLDVRRLDGLRVRLTNDRGAHEYRVEADPVIADDGSICEESFSLKYIRGHAAAY